MALFWALVISVGVPPVFFVYATVVLTLSKLDRPRLDEEGWSTLPLRLGMAVVLVGGEAFWLAWATITTDWSQIYPENGLGVFLGGPLLLGAAIAVFVVEDDTFVGLCQVAWPVTALAWLPCALFVGVARMASSLSTSLATILDRPQSVDPEFEALKESALKELEYANAEWPRGK